MGLHKKTMKAVLGFYFHEARRRPVAATVEFLGDHASVENYLNPLVFIKQDAEDRSRSDRGAEHAFEKGYRCEGDPGAAELLRESLSSKALVARGDEKIEMFLAFIAKEERFDHFHVEFCVDGGAILHRYRDIGF